MIRETAKEKAKFMVSQMTLDEKAAQLLYYAAPVKRLGYRNITGGTKRCMALHAQV